MGVGAYGSSQQVYNGSRFLRTRPSSARGGQYSTSNTMSVYTRGKKRKVLGRKGNIQQVVRNMEPAKHLFLGDNILNQAMTHNTMYTYNPTAQIAQGTNEAQRVGDFVDLQGWKINGYFSSPTTSNNPIQYRIIVGFSGTETNPGNLFGSGLGSSDVFFTPLTNLLTTSIINPKAFTVLDDRQFVINDYVAATSELVQFDYTVRLDQKFPYRIFGGTYGKFKNLYCVVLASVLGGTSGTTACGTIGVSSDLVFKDI